MNTQTPAIFVLVHGAWWSGDWWWRGVTEPIVARGHRVYTPTLTGLGSRAHLLSPTINLSTHIMDIVNLLKWEQLSDIVLVGHSYGGMVISGVAEQVPAGTIRSIVYLDAFLPEDSQALADIADNIEQVVGKENPVPPPLWFAGDNQKVAAALTRGSPHPRACFFEKIRLTGARDRIPVKTYVWAKQSPVFTVFYEKLKSDPTWRLETLPCAHMSMIELPEETAEIILRASEA